VEHRPAKLQAAAKSAAASSDMSVQQSRSRARDHQQSGSGKFRLLRQDILSLCHQGKRGSTPKPTMCSHWLTFSHPAVSRISTSQLDDLHRQLPMPAAKAAAADNRVKHNQVQKMNRQLHC